MSATPRTSDDGWFCNECCNGDRCDDATHYERRNCPHCKGSGIAIWNVHALKRKLETELAAARAEAFAECARICRERVPTEVPLLGHGAGATSVWPRIKGGDECARDIERAARKGTP